MIRMMRAVACTVGMMGCRRRPEAAIDAALEDLLDETTLIIYRSSKRYAAGVMG